MQEWSGTVFTLKAISGVATSVPVAIYSLASSSIATATTVVAATALLTFDGVKWVASQPAKLVQKELLKRKTDIPFDRQLDTAQIVNDLLKTKKIFGPESVEVKAKIRKYRSKFTVKIDGKKAYIITLSIKNKRVLLQVNATNRYFASLDDTLKATEVANKILDHLQ